MADSQELQRPNPAPTPPRPGQPLPRLWKTEEDPPTASKGPKPAEAGAKKGKGEDKLGASKGEKQKDKGKATKADGRKTVLREETPTLDTYESRQRVRILVGVGVVGVLGLAVLLLYQAFGPERSDEEEPIDFGGAVAAGTGPAGPNRERAEKEAAVLFDRARDVAEHGNATLAQSMLERLIKGYPGTEAATEAKEALARPARNLPMFLDRPTVVASGGEAPSSAPPEAPAVVDASPTRTAPAKGASADLELPSNAPAGSRAGAAVTASRPLPKGFKPRQGAEVHESGWPLEIVGDRDGATMVLVPGGVFLQGRDAEGAESPEHKVRLAPYYIDQTEVTVRQFKLFQLEAGRRQDRDRAIARDAALSNLDADDDRPVVMVSAREASDYAAWAGKRLPTEAQWEAAARTTDGRIFPWGTDAEPARDRHGIGPVRSFPRDQSPYGAFDLAGNAWEWTRDWYDSRYYQSLRFGTADSPTGPAQRPRSAQLVVKGSSPGWIVSSREGMKFDARLPYLGFRCVLAVEGPGNAFEPPAATAPAGRQSPGAPAPPGGASVPF